MKKSFIICCCILITVLNCCKKDDSSLQNAIINTAVNTVQPQDTGDVLHNDEVSEGVDNNGWDVIMTTQDGGMYFEKYSNSDSTLTETLMFILPSDSCDVIYGIAKFDEYEMPKYINCNGVAFSIERYYDKYFDAKMLIGDTIVIPMDSILIDEIISKAQVKHNFWRNACYIGKILVSSLAILKGVTMIGAGVVVTSGTGGAVATISVPMVASGVTTVLTSSAALYQTLTQRMTNDYNTTTISYGTSAVSNSLPNLVGAIANKNYPLPPAAIEKLAESRNGDIALLLASLGFDSIDAIFGETINLESNIIQKGDNASILTYSPTNITERSALLNGYLGPQTMSNHIRYGFIVRSSDGAVPIDNIDDGPAGYFSVKTENLKKATLYKCLSYVWDYTDNYIKFGNAYTFWTEGTPVKLVNVSCDKSEVRNGQINYHIHTVLELEKNDDVLDWGLYYMDGDIHKSYSLKDNKNTGIYDYNFTFESNIDDIELMMGTYVKYVNEKDITHYSDSSLFTFTHQNDLCPDENHPHLVDLGLPSGRLWSCCNVGATNPLEYGYYVSWGEIEPKSDYYYVGNYSYMTAVGAITKYSCGEFSEYYPNIVDNKTILESTDDAAVYNMGNNWKTPTQEDFEELINNCDWEWRKNYNGVGVNGYVIKGRTAQTSIFLPAGASSEINWRVDDFGEFIGIVGRYWSSNLYCGIKSYRYAYSLYFNESNFEISDGYRVDGFLVRAVRKQ